MVSGVARSGLGFSRSWKLGKVTRHVTAPALVATVLALASCAIPAPDVPAPNETQAVPLVAFGQAHPQCPLWTNWHQTCSRTGPDGEPYCVSDPDRVVEASEPFCVRTEYSGVPGPMSERQRSSALRFCEKTRHERIRDGAGNVEYEGTVCHRYRSDRPFSGRRLAARQHPLCERWSRGPHGLFQCAEWAPSSCRLSDGIPKPHPTDGGEHIIIPKGFDPDTTAVFGVFCAP